MYIIKENCFGVYINHCHKNGDWWFDK